MNTFNLIRLAIVYHWDAHRSNPVNLFAGVFGMMINNTIVLFGLWAMLFSGKPESDKMTLYFLTLNTVITLAWGSTCFFLGGFYNLAESIEDGSLEPMLSTPRPPLLLVGISQSVLPALGDLVQGLVSLGVVGYLGGLNRAFHCSLMVLISSLACVAVFILTGSIPFFVTRGSQLGNLLREICLSLSFYPTGKIFEDRLRWVLWLTPAAATALLPMWAIDDWGLVPFLASAAAAIFLFILAIGFFQAGLTRFQSASYVTLRG